MRPRLATSPEQSLATMWRLMRDGQGLKWLRMQMPEGATLEDALRLRRKLAQLRRTPSPVLDEELGIERD